MFCKNCGANLDDDAVFCDKCGITVKSDITTNEYRPINPTSSDGVVVRESVIDSQGQISMSPKKNRPITLVVAVIIAIVVAVATVVVIKIATTNNGTCNPLAESNFNNGGKMAFDDKTLYFVGLFDDDDSETCVYSTSYTGTNKTLISDNQDISQIRIVNGKILYKIYGEDKYCIGIMDKDGSNDYVIVELDNSSGDLLSDFDASSSTLYYLYNNELRTCSMNGSNDSLLLEDVNEFVMSGNTLYYATAESIFSYDIKKNQSAEICNSQASGLILDEGKIYFRNDSGIYSVVTTGDEGAQRVVKDSSVGNFVLDGKNIYYVQKLDTDDIISIAKVIDADKYTTYALLMYGSGQIECVSKFGGTPNDVDSDQLLSVALYVYPDGMYSKISFFSNALSHVEFE